MAEAGLRIISILFKPSAGKSSEVPNALPLKGLLTNCLLSITLTPFTLSIPRTTGTIYPRFAVFKMCHL